MIMKFTLIPLFLAVAAMSGCCALSKDQTTAYDQSNVSAPVYARIQKHQALTLADVVDLSHSGVRSSEIITYLTVSKSSFNLTQQEVSHLWKEGVSGDVIAYMRDKPENKGGIFQL
jgi:hypothetical protein